MEKNEVKKIMAILEIAYPNWVTKLDDEKLKVMVNLWYESFQNDNADLVANIVKAIIQTDPNPFPPNIAVIKQKIYELTHKVELTEQEAWNVLHKAICNSGYNSVEEWNNLPSLLKQLVTPELLREYSQMDSSQVNTVVSSNIMRSFRVRSEQHKRYEMLPDNLKSIGTSVKSIELNENGD